MPTQPRFANLLDFLLSLGLLKGLGELCVDILVAARVLEGNSFALLAWVDLY